jgi:hypothetical protein
LNQPSQPLATPYFFNGIGQKQNFKLMRRAHGISAARAAALPIRRLPKP